jgi:Lrp/AsnC family leucine-responsive transcriptional regulator
LKARNLPHEAERVVANIDYDGWRFSIFALFSRDISLMSAQKLDKVDAKIMQTLSKDGRISWRDLAEQIGLSLTPTLRRIRRLESEGYITGYSAQFDEQKLGFGITMYVWVSLERQVEETLKVFERRIADVPEVMSCYLMTGEADYVLRIVVPDLPSYQRFMLDVLTRIPGVSRIQSGLAIKPVFQRAAPPIPK